jgi:aromatic ring hydroxylase
MSNVVLPVDLVNRVLAYMATRPYSEVTDIISEIQTSATIQEPVDETPFENSET